MIKLNIGCGGDIRPNEDGWINLDVTPLKGVDIVWNLWKIPYPFKTNSVDYILAQEILEHIPHTLNGFDRDGFFIIIEELWRILKPDGLLHVIVPYYKHKDAFTDPQHTRYFTEETFDFFEIENLRSKVLGHYSKARFKLIKKKYIYRLLDRLKRLPINDYHIEKYISSILAESCRRVFGRKHCLEFVLRCVKS